MNRSSIILVLFLIAACGQPRTAGFFSGPILSGGTPPQTGPDEHPDLSVQSVPVSDTLVNCTFDNVLERPFGDNCPFETYSGALQIDNSSQPDPVVLLSTSGLQEDGTISADFRIREGASHCVVGLVMRADDEASFLLAGVNSRGQYTIQQCTRGLWSPVMGMEAFESSRLLPWDPDRLSLLVEVHDTYADLYVNGLLIQVVKAAMPVLGQVGVFVDGYVWAELDRFSVVPLD
jgi:hypothetical protein